MNHARQWNGALLNSLKEGNGVICFKGIRYAAVPSRFAKPEVVPGSVIDRQLDRDYGTFGPVGFQSPEFGPFAGSDPSKMFSEDCLYLNIWTPDVKPEKPLPVYVWVHGGGNMFGAGSEARFNMAKLACQGIVGVTINYRLNAHGFAAFETDGELKCNFGLLDVIAALKWVKENIADFGGDPDRVTLGGSSGGAYDTASLIMSPMAQGLFQNAIVQSGGYFGTDREVLKAAVKDMASQVAGREIADSREAFKLLKNADPLEIAHAWLAVMTSPGIFGKDFTGRYHATKYIPHQFKNIEFAVGHCCDGSILPENGPEAVKSKRLNGVNLLFGSCRDEANVIAPYIKNAEMLLRDFKAAFGDKYGTAMQTFGFDEHVTDHEAVSIAKHIVNICFILNGYLYADALSGLSRKVFHYRYDYVAPKVMLPTGMILPGQMIGAAHSAELPMIFKNGVNLDLIGEEGMQFSDTMSSLWVNFIKNGDPNGDNIPFQWPEYRRENRAVMYLDSTNSHAGEVMYQDEISFLADSFYGYQF